MDKNFVPRLFTPNYKIYYKLVKFLLKRIISNSTKLMSKTKFEVHFSKSLIILQVKKKKITTVKEVCIPCLNSIDFDGFTSMVTL